MAANTRQMLSDSHADVTLSPRHAGRAGEAGTRSSKVLADCGWLSQRCAVLALLVIASVVSWIGCIYFLFIVAPVNPLSGPGYMVLAPVNTMLLLLYWRGWDGVRNLVIIVNSVVIGAILPLPSEQFEYLPQAIVIPTALAMVLSSPRWVIGSSVGTIAVLLVRAGGATGPLGLPHVLAYGVTISCLVLSRLVIDAARREAEARADQAEQARAESERQAEKLRKQQASLHFQATLLGAVEQPVLATDPEGRMTYWNPAASQLFGWSEDAVLGRRFVEIEPPLYDLQTDDAWWEAHAWHGPSTREYAAQRRDGSTFPTLVSAWPIHDVDGTVLGQIAVISDLTERREVERQRELFEAGQKLRALGQMAGGIAHDLNQALAVVTGYVELALDGLPAAPNGTETRAYLDTAAQAAVQGATSIKRLLTFARQQDQGPPEIIDVGQTVEETVRFTAPQ